MYNQSLIEEILKYHPKFSEKELNAGLEFFELEKFKVRDIIIKQGKVAEYLYFAVSSITRCYLYDENGSEKTLWMEPEKMFITDFESFIKGTASKYNLQFYEKTVVYLIKRKDLLWLYENYKDWAVLGIRLMEGYHIRILGLFEIMFHNDATNNYKFIEQYFSRFLKVAPLKDIASMLNLSPVSLSRIRSGKQTKKVIS
ncbi:MAG: Crp/Fnr family transcriptional regulator [Ferruginibacter sp.]